MKRTAKTHLIEPGCWGEGSSSCSECEILSHCGGTHEETRPFSGWTFAFGAGVAFLAPPLFALVASTFSESRSLDAFLGLALGMVISTWVVNRLAEPREGNR